MMICLAMFPFSLILQKKIRLYCLIFFFIFGYTTVYTSMISYVFSVNLGLMTFEMTNLKQIEKFIILFDQNI